MRSSLLRRRWGYCPALDSIFAFPINPVDNSARFTVLTLNKEIRNNARKLNLAPCHLRCGFKVARIKLILSIGVLCLSLATFHKTLFSVLLSSFVLYLGLLLKNLIEDELNLKIYFTLGSFRMSGKSSFEKQLHSEVALCPNNLIMKYHNKAII